MSLKLSSKAKTLEDLRAVIKTATVLPQVRFSALGYKDDRDSIHRKCLENFSGNMIVRSSSSAEDGEFSSQAGVFDSVADVMPDEKSLEKAILAVIDSFGAEPGEKDEIFVQPMLSNVSMSGVVFTADLDTLSPYYIVNYDTGGSTSSITGGKAGNIRTYIAIKDYEDAGDERMQKLLLACRECEQIFGNRFLDIEFAFKDDDLYILQVRHISKKGKHDLSGINIRDSLDKLYKKIEKLNCSHPKLLGSKSIFGIMPDWNPAEMIGVNPKRLALSLYKELITDEIWAYQRDNYGYRNLRSFPLLVSFLGVPYIDVRVSFNSFIPKGLNDAIAAKLVEHYLEELADNANNHDKVEFEIVFSCYFFGLDKKLRRLNDRDFNENELKRIEFELLELTNKIIDVKSGLYKLDLQKIGMLSEKYDSILESKLSIVDKIYWLTEDCKRYGTLPFAGVARAAFIAVQFLNSFVDEGVMTLEEKDRFQKSLNTVSKQLAGDIGCMEKGEFLKKYGHLRPGTYDICSPRYDEAYDEYFSEVNCCVENHDFEFSEAQREMIARLIIENGIKCSCDDLIIFIKEAIEGREFAKFIFSRHLSKILSLIGDFGEKLGISKEDLAFLDIQQVKNLHSILDHREVKDIFCSDISKNKEYYQYTNAVKLPSLIADEKDIYAFYLEDNEPNFVTLNRIDAQVVDVESDKNSDCAGKIICIRSADPGYDYLFSKNIGGLITCYGGANSHMAIRCAELGIPAVIGCGENLYGMYSRARVITIDAASKQVKIIS